MDTVTTTHWLAENLEDENLVIADVRWRPAPPDAGRAAYLEAHIPGAIFIDLDIDLADVPEDPRVGGRHPLPTPRVFCERLAAKGIGRNSRIVCYDDMGGAIASRLWWMLRWVGHRQASVLDGGLAQWHNDERETESKEHAIRPASSPIIPKVDESMAIEKAGVARSLEAGEMVLDARAHDRYRGENETLDSAGGHISGAICAPFGENLDPKSKLFLEPLALRDRFRRLGVERAEDSICHCGSGVTACHNILAMERAGLGMARLYVGSWSEWSRDPRTAKAIGPRA